MHTLLVERDVINKFFEKIFKRDPRLYSLSQQPEIVLHSPYFDEPYALGSYPRSGGISTFSGTSLLVMDAQAVGKSYGEMEKPTNPSSLNQQPSPHPIGGNTYMSNRVNQIDHCIPRQEVIWGNPSMNNQVSQTEHCIPGQEAVIWRHPCMSNPVNQTEHCIPEQVVIWGNTSMSNLVSQTEHCIPQQEAVIGGNPYNPVNQTDNCIPEQDLLVIGGNPYMSNSANQTDHWVPRQETVIGANASMNNPVNQNEHCIPRQEVVAEQGFLRDSSDQMDWEQLINDLCDPRDNPDLQGLQDIPDWNQCINADHLVPGDKSGFSPIQENQEFQVLQEDPLKQTDLQELQELNPVNQTEQTVFHLIQKNPLNQKELQGYQEKLDSIIQFLNNDNRVPGEESVSHSIQENQDLQVLHDDQCGEPSSVLEAAPVLHSDQPHSFPRTTWMTEVDHFQSLFHSDTSYQSFRDGLDAEPSVLVDSVDKQELFKICREDSLDEMFKSLPRMESLENLLSTY